jgi:methionyl aminopeptidase
MEAEEISKIKEAGKIHQKLVEFAKEIVKPGVKLLDIANKIDDKIEELGGKPAFPINLSINEIAAHSTPGFNDDSIAEGLLKVDIGVQVDGYVADSAFSVDLEGSEENKNLIEAAEAGLNAGLKTVDVGVALGEIGGAIEKAVGGFGFTPIHNLSGHMIERYNLHAGVNVPNYDNAREEKLENGLYAIEPFATSGHGRVRDGKPSGIYRVDGIGTPRDNFAREVLVYIVEEYNGLPFCSRWIYKKFGSRGLLALRQLEQIGVLHQYAQLVEAGKGKVAQAEHTVLLYDGKKLVTTKGD